MRSLAVIPLVIAAVVGVGYVTCVTLGIDPHVREMLLAAGACLIATEVAIVPMILARGSAQPEMAQATLIGSMVHLFGTVALIGASMILLKSLQIGAAVAYWAMPLYWATLAVLVIGFVRAIRSAPPGPTGTATTLK